MAGRIVLYAKTTDYKLQPAANCAVCFTINAGIVL